MNGDAEATAGTFPPRYRMERNARQNRQTVLLAKLSLFIQID